MSNAVYSYTMAQPKFPLGQIMGTPNALNTIPNEEILSALFRHVRGDWGTLDAEDLQSNERALRSGGRLFSSYHSSQNVKFWIITECGRSFTIVLLPEAVKLRKSVQYSFSRKFYRNV